MSDKRFRIAILDDFEKLADTVPAYEKLKVRADVTILRERLDSPEKIERTLKEMDALLLMRERTYFSDNEYNRLPNLKLISQTGRTSRHLDLPSATRRGIAVSRNTGGQWNLDQGTHHRTHPGAHEKNSRSRPAHARGELAARGGPLARRKNRRCAGLWPHR